VLRLPDPNWAGAPTRCGNPTLLRVPIHPPRAAGVSQWEEGVSPGAGRARGGRGAGGPRPPEVSHTERAEPTGVSETAAETAVG
jgi:hypothetical protein